MASILVETETFATPTTVPDDGDAGNVASVNAAFQIIADRTKFLLGREMRLIQIATNTQSLGTSVQSTTSSSYVDITTPQVTLAQGSQGGQPDIQVGDIVVCYMSANWLCAIANQVSAARLMFNTTFSGDTAMAGTEIGLRHPAINEFSRGLFGAYAVVSGETQIIKAQMGSDGSNSLTLHGNALMMAALFKR